MGFTEMKAIDSTETFFCECILNVCPHEMVEKREMGRFAG